MNKKKREPREFAADMANELTAYVPDIHTVMNILDRISFKDVLDFAIENGYTEGNGLHITANDLTFCNACFNYITGNVRNFKTRFQMAVTHSLFNLSIHL